MIGEEGKAIYAQLRSMIGSSVDGKEAVTKMKNDGSKNWKQMEWMGFYLEELSREVLIRTIGGSTGPRYGRTGMDYKLKYVWDIKVHSAYDSKGKEIRDCVLNDVEAIENTLIDYGAVGFMLYLVNPEWDIDCKFKGWHDSEKGKVTDYVKERIERGAPSRMRKSAINVINLIVFSLSEKDIELGTKEGWIKGFQSGMRNSNGNPRRSKIMINTKRIPERCIIAKRA
ncbi:MAG: hypothetical protein FWD37_04380 [Methanomassiliicoccaceae archaeon]|nr:hypothetical protein [Methanomassiliicoccaceae archaeon]